MSLLDNAGAPARPAAAVQGAAVPGPVPAGFRATIDTAAQILRDYYRRRPARMVPVLVMDAVLAYGGGAFFFWFHAIVRGERGPQIANWHHWLLDSTLGFVLLLPAVAVLCPLARAVAGGGRTSSPPPWAHGAVLGFAFAIVTTPGPLVHNLIAGEHTWLAHRAEDWFGKVEPQNHPHPAGGGMLAEMGWQLALGIPAYCLLAIAACTVMGRWGRPARHRATRRDRVAG